MRNTRSEDARKIPPDEQSKGSDLMGPSHRTQAVAASFSSGFSRLVIVLLCEIVVVGLTVSLGISPALAVDSPTGDDQTETSQTCDGDPDIGVVPTNECTSVWFYDSYGWDSPHVYWYFDDNTNGGNWPGTQMVSDSAGWWRLMVPAGSHVLFSDGNGNQIPAKDQAGFEISAESWYAEGHWFTQRPNGITVHFYDSYGWAKHYVYWHSNNSSEGDSWPGSLMHSEGYGWYSYTIFGSATPQVLFSDGGANQIPHRMEPGHLITTDAWYRDGVWSGTEPAGVKIAFKVPDGWSGKSHLYWYVDTGSGAQADNPWPGITMEDAVNGWTFWWIGGHDRARVLFSDEAGHQDPGANVPGYDVSGEVCIADTRVWNASDDTDGDGLQNCAELMIGANPEQADSDGDALPDGWENDHGYNPTNRDTDADGVDDPDSDDDDDDLTALQEYNHGTDPQASDTDSDLLTDGVEVNTTHTDPLKPDTDGDGAPDGWEYDHGYAPLQNNAEFDAQVASQESPYGVQLSVDLLHESGNTVSNTVVSLADTDKHPQLSEQTPGFMEAWEIESSNTPQHGATLSMTWDASKWGEESDSFAPRIYRLDDETGWLEKLPDQIVTGHTVSAHTDHFSVYVLLDSKTIDAVWDETIHPIVGNDNKIPPAFAFVVDSSGSMYDSDRDNIRSAAISGFSERIQEVGGGAGIVEFSTDASVRVPYTTDMSLIRAATFHSYGGTNIASGISSGLDMVQNVPEGTPRYLVVLTDGIDVPPLDWDTAYAPLVDRANALNARIYTIGLGESTDKGLLSKIASLTHGSYFHASNQGELLDAYSDVADDTTDKTTDSNGDGITDYQTKLIKEGRLRPASGMDWTGLDLTCTYKNNIESHEHPEVCAANPSDDWDGDGIKNGDEMRVVMSSTGVAYIEQTSYFFAADSNFDGINDKEAMDKFGNVWERPVGSTKTLNKLMQDASWSYMDEQHEKQWRSSAVSTLYGTKPYDTYFATLADFFATYSYGSDISFNGTSSQDADANGEMIKLVTEAVVIFADARGKMAEVYSDIISALVAPTGYTASERRTLLIEKLNALISKYISEKNAEKVQQFFQRALMSKTYKSSALNKSLNIASYFQRVASAVDVVNDGAEAFRLIDKVASGSLAVEDNMDVLDELIKQSGSDSMTSAARTLQQQISSDLNENLLGYSTQIREKVSNHAINAAIALATRIPVVAIVQAIGDVADLTAGLRDTAVASLRVGALRDITQAIHSVQNPYMKENNGYYTTYLSGYSTVIRLTYDLYSARLAGEHALFTFETRKGIVVKALHWFHDPDVDEANKKLHVDREYLAPAVSEVNLYANYIYDNFVPDHDVEVLNVEVL